jgi:hypothetical protein
MRHRRLQTLLAIPLALIGLTVSTPAQVSGPLAPLQFLLGEWEGTGDQAGATGGFTFARGVQDHVIVRTNYSNTPAGNGRPASRHDDLMVIYEEAGRIKADYFDNEGHVIRYVAETRAGEIAFLSEIKSAEPRYRLTYTRGPASTLTGRFDVAPPGQPEAFTAYLSWTARKIN